jgi:3-oxoacyl-[acyl-carrier protein] reductase
MNLKLDNQLALVTASSGGIGLEIARSLAGEGARVIINGRSASSVDNAVASIRKDLPNAKVEKLVADNSGLEGTQRSIAQFPEVDILVNNLGIYEPVGFFEETDEAWLRLFEVNILSGVRLSRHYLNRMLAKKTGRIIFISSESGISPSPEMPHYSATKTMQLSISRSLAELTKGTQVTVNSILPGSTQSEGVAKLVQELFPDLSLGEAGRKFMRENRPTSLIERLLDPKEIANFVTYISSPLASGINGAALRVDGGLVRSVF